MSANNWQQCPRCFVMRTMMHERLMAELQADYGNVPPEEYLARLQVLQVPFKANTDADYTLREDYSQGMSEERGEYRADYSASCTRCGFEYSFTHKIEVDLEIPDEDDEQRWEAWRERLLHPELEKNRR